MASAQQELGRLESLLALLGRKLEKLQDLVSLASQLDTVFLEQISAWQKSLQVLGTLVLVCWHPSG